MKPLAVSTPAASRRTHLFAAALLWSCVGLALVFFGIRWVLRARSAAAVPVIGVAIGAGWLKARALLDRTARRIIARIESRGDGRCLGGFLSWRSWMLVVAMILLGRALRASPLPLLLRGALYLAIGVALSFASVRIWRAWLRERSANSAPD